MIFPDDHEPDEPSRDDDVVEVWLSACVTCGRAGVVPNTPHMLDDAEELIRRGPEALVERFLEEREHLRRLAEQHDRTVAELDRLRRLIREGPAESAAITRADRYADALTDDWRLPTEVADEIRAREADAARKALERLYRSGRAERRRDPRDRRRFEYRRPSTQ